MPGVRTDLWREHLDKCDECLSASKTGNFELLCETGRYIWDMTVEPRDAKKNANN